MNEETQNLIQNLNGKITEYKDAGNYLIYLFNDPTSVNQDVLKTLANSGLKCNISVLNGSLALFIFDNE